jgi:hypothetical protein
MKDDPKDMTSTMDTKWFKDVDAAGLSQLQEIGDKIEVIVQDTVTTVARARLRIGALLIDARLLFKGDKEFGQWRKEVLPDIAPRTANTYMNMAKHFKNAPELLEAVGWNAAREFMASSSDLKEDVQKKLAKGVTVEPAEVKEVVAERKASPSPKAPDPVPQAQSQASTPREAKGSAGRYSLDARLSRLLENDTHERTKAIMEGELEDLDPISRACAVVGFGPELMDRRPAPDIWDRITSWVFECPDVNQKQANYIEKAVKKIEKFWDESEED